VGEAVTTGVRRLRESVTSAALELAEQGLLPTALLRAGVRRMLRDRLREESLAPALRAQRREALLAQLRAAPVALATERANQQHYELPPEFFRLLLGPRLKYSACLFEAADADLAAAEERMLELTLERAGVADGMQVLDLGCGWGSLSLFLAERRPACRILAVSNSRAQGAQLRGECARRGLDRVEVVTADVNGFEPGRHFDRVVSVEMFEHVRNWGELLRRVAGWLAPDGRLFLHYFCHREHLYPYEARGAGDWMARTFFSGGLMPSADLPRAFPEHLGVEAEWAVSGEHYRHTLEAWRENLETRREQVLPLLAQAHGPGRERLWYQRWRLFFLACSELFGFRGGTEWRVAHVRMAAQSASTA
jgi:cyclopropane-fatty-acyl-phospholipid synthase